MVIKLWVEIIKSILWVGSGINIMNLKVLNFFWLEELKYIEMVLVVFNNRKIW